MSPQAPLHPYNPDAPGAPGSLPARRPVLSRAPRGRTLVGVLTGATIALLVQNNLLGIGRYLWSENAGGNLAAAVVVETGLCMVLLGLRVRPALRVALIILPALALIFISHVTAVIPATVYASLSWVLLISDVGIFLVALVLGQRDDIVAAFVVAGSMIALLGGVSALFQNAQMGNQFGYDPMVAAATGGGSAAYSYLGTGRSLAMTVAPAIIFCLAEVALSWRLAVNVTSLGFAVLLMVAGGGRSPAIGAVLMVVVALMLRTVRISRRRQAELLAALLVVVVALSASGRTQKLAINQRLTEMAEGTDTSAHARWEAKLTTLRLIGESPLIGQGSGTYDARGGTRLLSPHDLFLELGADYGLPVAISFLVGCLWLLLSYYRRLRRDAPVLSAAASRAQTALYLLLVFWVIQIPFIGMPSSFSLFAVAGFCVGTSIHGPRQVAGRLPLP